MTTYYTTDITRMPPLSIWRITWRVAGPLAVPLFAYLLARKLLGLRHRARWGAARPERIDRLAEADLPPDVQAAFAPAERACRSAGMLHVYYMKGQNIGSRESYAVAYLSADGTFYASLVWTRLAFGSQVRESRVFACHSKLADGSQLHTAAAPRVVKTASLTPPGHRTERLPDDTPPDEVMARHRELLREGDSPVRVRPEDLNRLVLENARQVFDHLIEEGIYVPLSEREVERLLAEPRPFPVPAPWPGAR